MALAKEKLGIIGVGYVGGAVKNWFKKQKNVELFVYDKFKKMGSPEEVNQAEIIFVCVPTPYHAKQGFDDSAVIDALKNIKPDKTVVIKSTVLPGSTERYQKTFPRLRLLFNPEFLVAKTANRDFLRPDRQIIGYTRQSRSKAARILRLLPKAPYTARLPATEAELIKYFCNTFLATRVIFGNQMYDLCNALGLNYERVKNGAAADPRIGPSHFSILLDGYRGYGGACLPKDTKSLIDFGRAVGVRQEILETVDRLNEQLIQKKIS